MSEEGRKGKSGRETVGRGESLENVPANDCVTGMCRNR